MATTTLAIASNRLGAKTFLAANVGSVAVDAAISESFILPTAPRFGGLLIEAINIQISTLSGAYVAPAPPFDGNAIRILSADTTTLLDMVGAYRWVNVLTSSARPVLHTWIDLQNKVLMRQEEILQVYGPIIGGAGVTANVACWVRGTRLYAGG